MDEKINERINSTTKVYRLLNKELKVKGKYAKTQKWCKKEKKRKTSEDKEHDRDKDVEEEKPQLSWVKENRTLKCH